jgi:hypothetical protein
MARLLRWQDEHRLLPMLLVFSLMLLGLCVVIAWPRGSAAAERADSAALKTAYARAALGATRPQLARLGFDAARPGVRRLSGLGVQEYFMPRSSRSFDALDPAVQNCFEAPDRCNVLIFPLADGRGASGLFAAHASAGPSGRIILLLHSGRLTYKEMSGA